AADDRRAPRRRRRHLRRPVQLLPPAGGPIAPLGWRTAAGVHLAARSARRRAMARPAARAADGRDGDRRPARRAALGSRGVSLSDAAAPPSLAASAADAHPLLAPAVAVRLSPGCQTPLSTRRA